MINQMTYTQLNYNQQLPFASFLPAIAGKQGIPMWVYYVNRGQAIAGFGIHDKSQPLLDFVPANVAYQRTSNIGFRTFIKHSKGVYEPFQSSNNTAHELEVHPHKLVLRDHNTSLNIKTEVTYQTVVNQGIAGLIRSVKIDAQEEVIVLDGLSTIYPSRTSDYMIKNMRNLAVAWMDVLDVDQIKVFKNRSATEDTSRVESSESAHYSVAFNEQNERYPIITDVTKVFGTDTSMSVAVHFASSNHEQMFSDAYNENQIPCSFAYAKGSSFAIYSIYGNVNTVDELSIYQELFTYEFILNQADENNQVMNELLSKVSTTTAQPMFDAYVAQSFLDNVLRGGYPLIFQGKQEEIVYHIYSRIHGDMEREYNDFVIEPSFYSQGNGNFRDVNQNRRNDVLFQPLSGGYNLHVFYDLIQLDGYNPLVIQGSLLHYEGPSKTLGTQTSMVLKRPFSLGELAKALSDDRLEPSMLLEIIADSKQSIQSVHGHGYWIDHWTYTQDMLENYLRVWPDKANSILFEEPFRYFTNSVVVHPFMQRVVSTENGYRQYNSVYVNQSKDQRIKDQGHSWEVVGEEPFTTSLYAKLMFLCLIKFYTRDPYGIGIMMEADKPGWNDAMNGLPGLFGSSVSESIELHRLLAFLSRQSVREFEIPQEWMILIDQLEKYKSFDEQEHIKETYVASIHKGITGKRITLATEIVVRIIEFMKRSMAKAIEQAESMASIIPSFIVYQPMEIQSLDVIPLTWEMQLLPSFLEAPARWIRQLPMEAATTLHRRVKSSELYDTKLQLYKTSVSLAEESPEIGRMRAFTPGWLERESCFLHMQFKYLLGLIQAGLIDEFFAESLTTFPPYMDPAIYGRNPLENVSFIATSNNPNKHLHGRGFVSRLTGTTTEVLSIWFAIFVGPTWFQWEDDELTFELEPRLPASFFVDGVVEFTLLEQTRVIYHNQTSKPTYGGNAAKIVSIVLDGEETNAIRGLSAIELRAGNVKMIEVYFQ